MNKYLVSVVISVEVQAFDEGDALEAVEDCFGLGENGQCEVVEYSVLSHEEF